MIPASSVSGLTRVLVSCGEPSGDLYAGALVRHLRQRAGPLEVFGLGGDRIEEAGGRLVAHVRDLAVVGLLEVLKHLRRLRGVFRAVVAEVDRERPAVAVLVDYAEFNLRLARELKSRGVPVVYYVSPQVWAWRRSRVRAIRERVTRMVVIFPFEEPLYREAGVPVTFVGHPLVDLARPAEDRAAFLASQGLDPGRPVVAVLPGSRPQEVAHNLPPIAGGLRLLRERRAGFQYALAVAPSLDPRVLDQDLGGPVTRVAGRTHALLSAASAGIVASGTATVEAALMGLPSVVVYRLSPVTYALGRPFVRVPHYAMANLIAGREVYKELIQSDFQPESVAREVVSLVEDSRHREDVKGGLKHVRDRLGPPGASDRAAEVVAEVLRKHQKRLT